MEYFKIFVDGKVFFISRENYYTPGGGTVWVERFEVKKKDWVETSFKLFFTPPSVLRFLVGARGAVTRPFLLP